ncbi:MAG: RNA 2',3'-cyclic phosphodiesterase [Nitrosopumilus sp. H8]|nr:MAG: RNA 2',3'-cyclic phosphodiesterase [Nitrosopumilus sp. H13]RNJ79740.1 MAG: RNA 2',3'-cyclic phosphodiesterase [Nitrosopumilus sp. H8]
MRVFVAAGITDAEVIGSIKRLQSELGIDARPVAPENLHFTLQFLGEIAEVSQVIEALRDIKFDAFDVALKGVGMFPGSGPPRTVWIGADDGGRLSGLAKSVEAALAPLGFCRDRPFVPHLTVFRVKKKAGKTRDKLDGMGSVSFGVQHVAQIKLKSSALNPEGSTYSDLWESGT